MINNANDNEEEGSDSGPGMMMMVGRSVIAVENAPSLDSAYELGKTIGRGEFAKVKVARCRKSKRLVGIPAEASVGSAAWALSLSLSF